MQLSLFYPKINAGNFQSDLRIIMQQDTVVNWMCPFINGDLKGVFAKKERGYRLNAIKRRFWSLLILLLSVSSIRRKQIPNNLASIQIEKIATYNLDPINQFNCKQIIQILQPIVIDYLSPHLYIVDIS